MTSGTDIASRHVSQVIHADPSTVYDFAFDVSNLPKWAAGLATSPVTRRGDRLVVAGPTGEVTVRFVERNEFGVLDHDVTLPSGTTVNNPMRVLAHPQGAEVIFTVRQIELTDDEFERDVEAVRKDLAALGDRIESRDDVL